MNKIAYYLLILSFIFNNAFGQSVEKICLSTDRDLYIAGENMFFTCYRYDADPKLSVRSNFAYLVLRNENNILITGICLKLDNNVFSGSLYLPDTLKSGMYQLVSFTNYMRNAGENSFFKKEVLIVNRFDQELTSLNRLVSPSDTMHTANFTNPSLIYVEPEKSSYRKHENIRIIMDATGIKKEDIAQLSISVRERTSPFATNNNLQSIDKSEAIQNNPCIYLPEINGIFIEGCVTNPDNQEAISNAVVFLSTSDSVANLQITKTNDEGKFHFLLNNYYENKNLILSLPEAKKGHIEIANKYELKVPFRPLSHFTDTLIKKYIRKSQNIVEIQKIYKLDYKHEVATENKHNKIWPRLAYPPQPEPVCPSDFEILPDFVEISREILPFLKTRKYGDRYEAKIWDVVNKDYFSHEPLIFLDGVPINSVNQIIDLGTEKIKKIETLPFERYYGDYSFYGILSVFSYDKEINKIVWEKPMISTKYLMFHSLSVLQMPVYSKSDRVPDFRQLLYWEPSVKPDVNENKAFEFPGSANKGEFEIVVEGITNSGKPISAKNFFKVESH